MSKILVKSAWGSDDPTKAAFAFGWPPVAETLQATIALGIPIHV